MAGEALGSRRRVDLLAIAGAASIVAYGALMIFDPPPPEDAPHRPMPAGHPPTISGAQACGSAIPDGVTMPWAHTLVKIYGCTIMALVFTGSGEPMVPRTFTLT